MSSDYEEKVLKIEIAIARTHTRPHQIKNKTANQK